MLLTVKTEISCMFNILAASSNDFLIGVHHCLVKQSETRFPRGECHGHRCEILLQGVNICEISTFKDISGKIDLKFIIS